LEPGSSRAEIGWEPAGPGGMPPAPRLPSLSPVVTNLSATTLVTALEGLTSALDATGLELDLDRAEAARATRTELRDQIVDYLVPRLKRLDAPLLAVLGGSTGSGKSTITNSLVGIEVSRAGVLRPTTRAPVLVCHPDDEAWFAGGDVLPELPRLTGEAVAQGLAQTLVGASGTVLRVVTTTRLDAGLAIIDAPDIDSVEEANRTLATQLLAAADLWLFTTTAVRYADAVPWEFLRQAQARGTSLAVIINRIPPGAAAEIVAHFGSMLERAGLGATTVFPLDQMDQMDLVDGRLPAAAIAPIQAMLTRLAHDADERAAVVARTLEGALSSITPRVQAVTAAGDEQNAAADGLRSSLEETYTNIKRDLATDVSGGSLLRGEVLERWQELIGTAELMRALQSRISWLRDRLGSLLSGRPSHTAEVEGEITSTLERLLIDYADKAALLVATNWRNLPGGRQVLAGDRSLERSSDELRAAIGGQIRAWQDDILDLVRTKAAGKRTTARVVALGVNSIGVALMIVLFASTGGITGGEIAIGAGTAGLSQTLLTAIFGEQAVRELATEALRNLLDRVGGLLDADANRFRTRLWSNVSPPEQVGDLRAALQRLEQAR
jgi:energy-coupling factor transporter ATP-binding protein EcfA2